MDIGALTATLGVDSSGLRKAEGDLRSFASTADNQFSSVIGKAAALAASLLTVSVAIKAVTDAATVGMKVETMGVVMTQIGKNVGVSSEALKYFTEQVKSAGVTGMEAMSALSKAMVLGLNLNQMKEFTTRVRDIAVGARDAEGNLLNTSQTLMRVMHGIESGQVEVLRTMGISVRAQEEVYKSYGATIGKTKEQMNTAEKAQAMLNEVMRASEPLTGAAAAADATVGKQLASMARYSEEAKVALWDLFQPAMMQGVMLFTNAFKEIKTWADLNKVSLGALGLQIGTFVGNAGVAAMETIKWAAANFELIKALTELYIISKVISWINSLQIAIQASSAAISIFTGVTQGLIPVLFGAATTSTIFASGATGMATAMYSATAAGSALNAMMVTLLPAIVAVVAALGAYGAYKTFKEPGQLTGPTSSGDPFADVAGGVRDKDLAATAAAEFVGPASPPEHVLQMNKIMGQQQKYIDEANAAQAMALAKPSGAGKGGGKGGKDPAEAAAESLKSFIETMKQETARGAGDSEAILNAWYGKQTDTLSKMALKGADITAGKEALDAAYYSKLDKLDSDFNDYYISGLGKSYEALYAAEDKKLKEVAGNADKTAKVQEVFSKKWQDLQEDQQITATNLFKGYLDAMAGLSPILADQLGYKKQALALELNLADLALDKQLREQKITQEMYDQAKGMQALVAQAKKYALEREGWMKEGIGGGLKAGALDRDKESATRTAQWTIDAMKGAETWLGETGGQAFVDYLHGKKADLSKMFQDMGDSLIKQLFKMGTTKAFDSIWGEIGKALGLEGKGKPDGSVGNPFHVTFDGAKGIGGLGGGGTPDFEKRAEKIGYTRRGGGDHDWDDEAKSLKTYEKLLDKMYKGQSKDMGGIQRLQERFYRDDLKDLNAYGQMQQELIDQNQELFKSEYLTDYENSFTGMTTNMTNVWGVAQGLMTAAGVSGDTQRLMSLGNYAMQGIGIIQKFAKSTILTDAYRAAAAAFAWMVELLPPPAGQIAGAAAAAITFAAISAYGLFGGETSGIASSAGGDYQVGMTGPRFVHQDETILPPWAAESWRNIVRRENAGSRPGENAGGSVVYSPTYHINAIDGRGVDAILEKHGRSMTKVINREVGRRGRRL